MLERFDPKYTLPTHKYFSKVVIPSLYACTHRCGIFCCNCIYVVLEPYMSYTIHYVAADWMLQSHCLQTLYLPKDHTGGGANRDT